LLIEAHTETVPASNETETVDLFEGDEELSGSFEGRGTGRFQIH
jgi:acetylornithine deacetylase/succinyl-diaminopimelate desuccinylase-like protein